MDYPFYLREMHTLSEATLQALLQNVALAAKQAHPHFLSKERNRDAFQVDKTVSTPLTVLVNQDLQQNSVLQGSQVYWHEINTLAAKGQLGAHSDLAHAGYNTDQGTPMEILLTHKIHVHIAGDSVLSFRRSLHEKWTHFYPEVGKCYWYNNYVWHKSYNPGEVDRTALSMIYHDRRWIVRGKLFESMGIRYNDCYQLEE